MSVFVYAAYTAESVANTQGPSDFLFHRSTFSKFSSSLQPWPDDSFFDPKFSSSEDIQKVHFLTHGFEVCCGQHRDVDDLKLVTIYGCC